MSLILLVAAIAQANFTLISPMSIQQTQELNLGFITNQVSNVCQLDSLQRQGSGCIESDNQLGKFSLSGDEQASVDVIVYTNTTTNVQFTPILPNGSQQQTFTLTSTPLIIEVGGKVDVLSNQSHGEQQLTYTIEVNYQ
ncbi:hypothetical protein [Shewanella donghaensis]|uniref:hypothetical protein n=1 Tax=Shewanella donghaensis TaxID=238836 RepID=UPI001182E332|nr:hypothetical protein [Shewanella donghaensis]